MLTAWGREDFHLLFVSLVMMPFDFPGGPTAFLDCLFQAACGKEPPHRSQKNKKQWSRKTNSWENRSSILSSVIQPENQRGWIPNLYISIAECFLLRKYWANHLAGETVSGEVLFLFDLAEIVSCELTLKEQIGINPVSEEKRIARDKEIVREERLLSINTMKNYYHKIERCCHKVAEMGIKWVLEVSLPHMNYVGTILDQLKTPKIWVKTILYLFGSWDYQHVLD